MIKRKDEQWTTVQCKNLVGDNGEICDLCFKVLNDRFALTQQCPYCLGKIDLRPHMEAVEADTTRKQFPKVRKEDTVGYQRKYKNLDPDCDELA